ncbi:MAG TPA: aminotransferase class III-fold pyridoxal phosphate-dependent enzyme, partial [Baekduia sp.]|nr:aminotransferase class III-fold pyridoxal phosphate-dependent enzyme [Baekduia sp.]
MAARSPTRSWPQRLSAEWTCEAFVEASSFRAPLMTTTTTLPRSSELLGRARQVMPGGVLATYAMPDEVACVISHGAGGRVYDLEGNEYIDYVLGSGPMIVGHSHPQVVAALERQISRGTQFYTLTEPAIELSELLVAAIPCADRVKLVSSGAEATFQALRVARAATGRDKVLKFKGAYHGHHDYAMHGSGMATAGIPGVIDDALVTGTYNDADSAVELIERHRDELAAVIVEPVQRNTSPRDGFLQALRDATAANDVVLIFDEMVTGFRVSWGGGQERFGVIPDLATYGKAIGGGLPVAAIAGREELMRHLDPRRSAEPDYVYCSGTLNGNPLGAAAGLATLKVLGAPGAFARLEAIADRLRAGLSEAAACASFPVQVVGEGAMAGVLFADGDPLDPTTPGRGDAARRRRTEIEMLRHGIFINLPA